MRRRIAVRGSREAGFSLVEVMVAFGVLVVLMSALAATAIGGYRALREARFFQQATALGNEAIEQLRDLTFDQLIMKASDVASDPATTATCTGLVGTRFYDSDRTGPLKCELLVTAISGSLVTPHVTTETVNGKVFTITRYIVWADDVTQGGINKSYKRVSIVVVWSHNGEARTFRTSTLMTSARRGLPTPEFVLSPVTQGKEVEASILLDEVVFAHSIRNDGIIDAYDLVMPPPSGKSWNVRFYEDVGGDGEYNPLEELVELDDTNDNGIPDTDLVDTNETFNLLVVWDLSFTEPLGTHNVVLTVTSGANDEIVHTATDVLTVGPPSLKVNLHNNPSPPIGNTNAVSHLSMDDTPITGVTLYNYSQNHYSARPGRFVARGGSDSSYSDNQKFVNWVYQIPEGAAAGTFQGAPVLKIWVATKDFVCDKSVRLTAHLREKATSTATTGTTFASVTSTIPPEPDGSGACGFQLATVTFPSISRTIAKDRWLELKIVTSTGAFGAEDGLFAYDTTTYNSTLKLPKASS